MMPGPTLIRRCSVCAGLIAQETIVSGNTFGARFWTDGKREAPMLPDEPWLVKCEHCGALVWIDEQEEVGEVEMGNFGNDTFKDARPYVVPSIHDYFTVLEKGVSDIQKERYLRLRAWWAGNDTRRQNDDTPAFSDGEISNLGAFAKLLDESGENDRIMKAEAMRELGKYEEAMALLSKPFSDGMSQAVAIINSLAIQRIPFVREMEFK